jgi:hypothetical protein
MKATKERPHRAALREAACNAEFAAIMQRHYTFMREGSVYTPPQRPNEGVWLMRDALQRLRDEHQSAALRIRVGGR